MEACEERTHTEDHISWCPRHAKELLRPILNDFEKHRRRWPDALQRKITLLEDIALTADETHELLYSDITPKIFAPKIFEMEQSSSVSETVKSGCRYLLKAIATYRARFNPQDEPLQQLFKFAFTFVTSAVTDYGPPVVCGLLAYAVPAFLVSSGLEASNEDPKGTELRIVGYVGLIGASLGGPLGAAVGTWLGDGRIHGGLVGAYWFAFFAMGFAGLYVVLYMNPSRAG